MPPSPFSPLPPTIYTGTFIHTPTLSSLQVLENHAVGVDEEGVIRFICTLGMEAGFQVVKEVEKLGWDLQECKIVEGGKGGNSWWFPGFVDTHIHASQYPNAGIFGKTTLLDWLHTYTFPLESSLSSLPLARRVYTRCVTRTLSHGTTTASYFATLHVASTNLLASICLQKGQRAFIGRVCMDSDLSPEYIRDESPEQAIANTEATITHINTIDPQHRLITPILTPRFAPSCTSPLLHHLGHLATTTSLPIQTHISENPSEISLVRTLFPTHDSYAHVYDAHSLLTPRTILAHAIHLSPSERALIKERQSSVSHCPVSNTSLSSGLCPVRELLDQGIRVGLGTDVSGGYSPSILTAAREAGMVSRTVAALTNDDRDHSHNHNHDHSHNNSRNRNQNRNQNQNQHQNQNKTQTQHHPHTLQHASHSHSHFPARDNVDNENPKTEARYSTPLSDRAKLSVEECLYLATRGGAECLNMEKRIGGFEVGMEWDAQLIQLSSIPPLFSAASSSLPSSSSPAVSHAQGLEMGGDFDGDQMAMGTGMEGGEVGMEGMDEVGMGMEREDVGIEDGNDEGLVELWGNETWSEKVAKWLFCGDDRNTRRVYVRGRLVYERRG